MDYFTLEEVAFDKRATMRTMARTSCVHSVMVRSDITNSGENWREFLGVLKSMRAIKIQGGAREETALALETTEGPGAGSWKACYKKYEQERLHDVLRARTPVY